MTTSPDSMPSAKLRSQFMRIKNTELLPSYLILDQNKALYDRNPLVKTTGSRGEGKRTSIPVPANIISRQNTFESLNLSAAKPRTNTDKVTPYERVLQKLMVNKDDPAYIPTQLPPLSPSKQQSLQ